MLRAGKIDIVAPGGGPGLHVVRLRALPEGFEELAADATGDGVRLLDVLRQDWRDGTLRFDQPGEVLFAAMAGPSLLGICGLTRDPYAKAEGLGRVRRLYVRRAARRGGAGRALLEAVAEAAGERGYQCLRVRSPVSAFAFYERCAFLRAVGEASATHMRQL